MFTLLLTFTDLLAISIGVLLTVIHAFTQPLPRVLAEAVKVLLDPGLLFWGDIKLPVHVIVKFEVLLTLYVAVAPGQTILGPVIFSGIKVNLAIKAQEAVGT